MKDALDPRTPVIVGVGQFSERVEDDGYQGLSVVDLAARAAAEALADTGVEPGALARRIDTVGGIRQFEISTPNAPAPLGRSTNYPRSVANRIGAEPARAILEIAGGQGPQHLLTELAASIASGQTQVALIFGSEAISTVRHLAGSEDPPDFSENVAGSLEDRGMGLKGLISMPLANHGLVDAPSQYALFENARRARLGLGREEYAAQMGALFAPFTRVAAQNPHAAAPVARSAEELTTVSERNRLIAQPYPRFLVARDQVNQAAAVLLMSVAQAEDLGIAPDRMVFLHGHADTRERPLLDRPDLSRSASAVAAASTALEMAGIGVDQLATFDLYSCFPVAVSNVADGLGLGADDPRGLTLTGGLPFFGGAGNNYSMHAIAETVQRCRQLPGSFGFVGANGGTLSKYSAGVYSTTPVPWSDDVNDAVQSELDRVPPVPTTDYPEGWAHIETYTVRHGKDGRLTAIVVGRLDESGERFVAMGLPRDEAIVDLLTAGEPVGQRVYVRSFGYGNRVAVDKRSMDAQAPVTVAAVRAAYEHLLVRRDGHLLEVTINRPDSRNALHPPAHEELAEVFDAFFDDPELWVAILTGAGTRAFCAGNDLIYTATGKPMYVPRSGFAGLTSRRHMAKPVIAAVNGFAMGGGLETALACHLMVVDEAVQLALSEVRVGLIAGAGGLIRLPRQIPRKIATEMILTGRRMGAAEALERGLANRVVPVGTALEGARALANEILQGSPTSVRLSLQVMAETEGVADSTDAVLRRTEAIDELITSEDMAEGLAAFAQKRAPRWRGR